MKTLRRLIPPMMTAIAFCTSVSPARAALVCGGALKNSNKQVRDATVENVLGIVTQQLNRRYILSYINTYTYGPLKNLQGFPKVEVPDRDPEPVHGQPQKTKFDVAIDNLLTQNPQGAQFVIEVGRQLNSVYDNMVEIVVEKGVGDTKMTDSYEGIPMGIVKSNGQTYIELEMLDPKTRDAVKAQRLHAHFADGSPIPNLNLPDSVRRKSADGANFVRKLFPIEEVVGFSLNKGIPDRLRTDVNNAIRHLFGDVAIDESFTDDVSSGGQDMGTGSNWTGMYFRTMLTPEEQYEVLLKYLPRYMDIEMRDANGEIIVSKKDIPAIARALVQAIRVGKKSDDLTMAIVRNQTKRFVVRKNPGAPASDYVFNFQDQQKAGDLVNSFLQTLSYFFN